MSIRKLSFRFLLIFIFGFFNINNFGQTKVSTSIGQFLKIEPSARYAAMGNAGSSLFGEVSSVFYNPASLGHLQSSDVQFTHSNWLADISYNYAAVAVKIGEIGTLSLQATSLNSGDIEVRTVQQPLGTGEQYSVSDFALGVGYGLMLTDRVSVGVIVNYYQESIWHSSLGGFGINLGVQYQVETDGLTIGASLLNFGPKAGYNGRDLFLDYDFDPNKYGDNDQLPAELRTETYNLPTTFRVGLSYPLKFSEDNSLTLAVDATHPNDNNESVSIGGEWNILHYFSLRGGYRNLFLQDSEGGLVLGAGVNVNFTENYNIRFDYAWADYGRLDKTHRFTVGVGF